MHANEQSIVVVCPHQPVICLGQSAEFLSWLSDLAMISWKWGGHLRTSRQLMEGYMYVAIDAARSKLLPKPHPISSTHPQQYS